MRALKVAAGWRIMRESRAVASAHKPVIVRKLTRDWMAGYASAAFGKDAAELEILDLNGKLVRIGWEQVKWVCYVRELPPGGETGNLANPERLLHRRFSVRPRTAGLWVRLVMTDGEELEGIAANDRSMIDGPGLMLTPPDTRSNSQRIYVPRQAIQTLEVAAVIGAASRKHTAAPPEQPELFANGRE
jgi:Family of unknown function (DUF6982)